MTVQCDCHIHTKYLACADLTMEIPAIIAEGARIGNESLSITDHLNTIDKLKLHRDIKKELENLHTLIPVFFGVELNFTGNDEGFVFDSAIKEELGFQFAIGGIHDTYVTEYDLEKIVDIQHRHHLKTCEDPLVDVLVHPYWFGKNSFTPKGWPWFDSMKVVPEAYVRELGRVARETGTAIEINGGANLCNPAYSEDYVKEYIDYLTIIAEEGPLFAFGSDAHTIGRLGDVCHSWKVAEKIGLASDRIWHPRCPSFTKQD